MVSQTSVIGQKKGSVPLGKIPKDLRLLAKARIRLQNRIEIHFPDCRVMVRMPEDLLPGQEGQYSANIFRGIQNICSLKADSGDELVKKAHDYIKTEAA